MTIKQRKKEEGGKKQGEKKTNKKGGEPNNKREATPASSGKLVLKIFGYSLVAAIIFLGMLNQERITRLYNVATLFHESKIVDNFRNTYYRGFPYRTAHHDPQRVAELLVDSKGQRALPSTFVNEGTKYSTAEFLQSTWTTGLVVLKIDSVTSARLLHESYYLGNTPRNKVISWSTGKSVVSALFGIAHAEGLIKSLHDPVTDYAPLLKGSGYEQVKIKDVLQMSSGIRFNEDYFDPFSDINVMGYVIGLGWSINEFVATLSSSREPGTFNHYVSMDTQVLGIILSEVLKPLNKTLTSYLEEKLWRHGGFEADVLWLLDNDHNQIELAFGTLNARTRDYARFGWLFHNRGKSPYDGRQLVPEQWVIDSTKPDAPHLQPGHHHLHDYPFGYGYQWWLPGSEEDPSKLEDDYLAIGVYNQFIYISPRHNIVIARNSANAHYEHGPRESESKAVSLFRTIAKAFADE